MGVCNCSMFCSKFLYVHSSFAIILMEKSDLVALLSLSSWCLVIVVWLFLRLPWVCLQFGFVVFSTYYILSKGTYLGSVLESYSIQELFLKLYILMAMSV